MPYGKSPLSSQNIASAQSVSGLDDAYKAVVKIKTFTLSAFASLYEIAEGSGIFISQDGIILTNAHVVTVEEAFDNSPLPAAYQICITKEISKEPQCLYTAKLIGKDSDLDIALLKIEPISGLSQDVLFPYLNLNQTDNTKVGDPVTVIGYPAIGGQTVTISKGIISGKLDKYGKSWIKTDAVVSFGNSGGATLDAGGNVIGITTAVYSDMLGSLGYVTNITSLNNWINWKKSNQPEQNSLITRLVELTKKQEQLKNTNLFKNTSLPFSITKPAQWDFDYTSENGISMDQHSNPKGGMASVTAFRGPYVLNTQVVEPFIKRIYNADGTLSLVTITQNKNTVISGKDAKLVTLSGSGKLWNAYVIPYGQYLILIDYKYGEDDLDKSTVDGIIKTLAFKELSTTTESHSYSLFSPAFYLNSQDAFPILAKDSKDRPLELWNKNIKEAFVFFRIIKTDENTNYMDRDGYLNYLKQLVKEQNQAGASIDYKAELTNTNAHYKLNDELTDVIFMEMQEKRVTEGETLVYDRDYYIKSSDKYIYINLSVYSADKTVYEMVTKLFRYEILDFCARQGRQAKRLET